MGLIHTLAHVAVLSFVAFTLGSHFVGGGMNGEQRRLVPRPAYTPPADLGDAVTHTEAFVPCGRGHMAFTQTFVPVNGASAVIAYVHGYGDTSTNTNFLDMAYLLASKGYAFVVLDHQGSGLSDGLHAHYPDITVMVDDAHAVLHGLWKGNPQLAALPAFLFGESMGGAMTLLLSELPDAQWSGMILSAPMVGISDEMKPPQAVTDALSFLAAYLPTWTIVPAGEVIDNAFRDPARLANAHAAPLAWTRLPRLATALEMLRLSDDIQSRLDTFDTPFLVLHGANDIVTDPALSQALYDQSPAADKSIKIYDGAWHALLQGEPEPVRQQVANDVHLWIQAHLP